MNYPRPPIPVSVGKMDYQPIPPEDFPSVQEALRHFRLPLKSSWRAKLRCAGVAYLDGYVFYVKTK